MNKLEWKKQDGYEEALLGEYTAGDGVRFTLTIHPTCYRRGPYKLLIEVAGGENHHKWGCFDEDDQPTRWFHGKEVAFYEAQAIADVLYFDRFKRGFLAE